MVLVFGLITIASVLSVVFAKSAPIIDVDTRMHLVADISAFGAMVFSAVALVVSAMAYKAAVKNPKLQLVFDPWLGEVDKLVLPIDEKPGFINITRPLTTWKVWLHNSGNASARYPLVEIKFKGMFFREDDLPGWKATHHSQPWGWYGFQWSPGETLVVHPNFPVELPSLRFAGHAIAPYGESSKEVSVSITIAADGFYEGPTERAVELID